MLHFQQTFPTLPLPGTQQDLKSDTCIFIKADEQVSWRRTFCVAYFPLDYITKECLGNGMDINNPNTVVKLIVSGGICQECTCQ